MKKVLFLSLVGVMLANATASDDNVVQQILEIAVTFKKQRQNNHSWSLVRKTEDNIKQVLQQVPEWVEYNQNLDSMVTKEIKSRRGVGVERYNPYEDAWQQTSAFKAIGDNYPKAMVMRFY